jgi:hypothetical protein
MKYEEALKRGGYDASAREKIYFLRRKNGDIKIGRSTDLDLRVDDVERKSGPVDVAATTPGGHLEEQALHRCFAAHRKDGEWFASNEELEDLIRDLVERQKNGSGPLDGDGESGPGDARTWWLSCALRTTEGKTPVHELIVPDGRRVVLLLEDLLSPKRVRDATLRALRELPPFPAKRPAQFLQAVTRGLLAGRETISAATKEAQCATLESDIVGAIRGAIPEGKGFSAVDILERTQEDRTAHLTLEDVAAALRRLGCERRNGDVWIVPEGMFSRFDERK